MIGTQLLAALSIVAAASVFGAESPRGPQSCEPDRHGPGGPPPPGFAMGLEEDRPPPYLMDVDLTDEQQDKVFAILHAAAPQLRERSRAARKAREALRELGQSAQFDDGHAMQLAEAEASAESQIALLHTRVEHDIYLVLTAEQRAHIAAHLSDAPPHVSDGPPHRREGMLPPPR